jgi:hypothetical protein
MIMFGVGARTLVGSHRKIWFVGKMSASAPSTILLTAIVSSALSELSPRPVDVIDWQT